MNGTTELSGRLNYLEQRMNNLSVTVGVLAAIAATYMLASLWLLESRWLNKKPAALTRRATGQHSRTLLEDSTRRPVD